MFIYTFTVSGGIVAGDVVSVRVQHSAIGGGSRTVSYTVQGTDTLNSVASAIASALAADQTLVSTFGVTASASSATVTVSLLKPSRGDVPPVVSTSIAPGHTLAASMPTVATG